MKKIIFVFLVVMICISMNSLFSQDYVGAGKCKMCHKTEKQGQQHPKWEAAKHSKAFQALSSADAADKAKQMGVEGSLPDNPKCLKCHGSIEGFKEEGVTCEACHGPGSGYKKMSTMKDHAKSVAAGMKEYGSPDVIKTHCTSCHDNAHGAAFDFDASWGKIKHPRPDKG